MIDKVSLGNDIRRRIHCHGLYAAARWAMRQGIDVRFFINAMNARV